jgi:hypothetical protein
VRRLSFAAVAIAVLCIVWAVETRYALRARTLQYDFVPFACGAEVVVVEHADPYRIEPLRTCEHRAATIFPNGSLLVVPAPLPPYALDAFAPFGLVPFPVARWLWLAAQLTAYAMTLRLLRCLTGLPTAILFAATLCSLLIPSLLLGQIVPFAVLGLCLAAEGLERKSTLSVGIGIALASLEPHLAVPSAVAIALFARERTAALVVGAVAVTASLATLGAGTCLEYLTRVLPAHVASELDNREQYGIPYLLHLAGLAPTSAERIGELVSLAGLALAPLLARTVVRATGRRAFLALAPPLLALLTSPFLHVQQFAVAIPAALLFCSLANSRLPRAATALLAVPWGYFYALLPFAPVAGTAFGVIVGRLARVPPRAAILGACLAATALAGAELLRPIPAIAFDWSRFAGVDPGALAETLWQPLVSANLSDAAGLYAIAKVPTFLAVAFLVVTATRWRPTQKPEAIAP